MKQYRRKPLQLIEMLPAVLQDGIKDRHQGETLPSGASQSVPPATEPISELITEPTQLFPSPEALVEQAATILEQDQSATPGAPSLPASGLVDELHQFVNDLATLIDRKAELTGQEPTPSSGAQVPLLQPNDPSPAGETVQITFKVDNDSPETRQTQFYCSDLYSTQGDRIPQQALTITPNPLTLEAQAMATLRISIQLPPTVSPGEYAGVLMATGLSDLKAMISLQVTG